MTKPIYIRLFTSFFKGREMIEMLDAMVGKGEWCYGSTSHGASKGVWVPDDKAAAKVKLACWDMGAIHSIESDARRGAREWTAFLARKKNLTVIEGPVQRIHVTYCYNGRRRHSHERAGGTDYGKWFQSIIRDDMRALTGKVRINRLPSGHYEIVTTDPAARKKIAKMPEYEI